MPTSDWLLPSQSGDDKVLSPTIAPRHSRREFGMDAFLERKRPRLSSVEDKMTETTVGLENCVQDEEDSTDLKLAMLISLHPQVKQDDILDILVSCNGSVSDTASIISSQGTLSQKSAKKRAASGSVAGVQTSISAHILTKAGDGSHNSMLETTAKRKLLSTKKGQTLHLYTPEDITTYTPCTIVHNFLPSKEANALLTELLDESKYFSRSEFQLFNRTVQSPHSASVYVSTPEEYRQQTSEYTYGGTSRSNVRQATSNLLSASQKVQQKVNEEIKKRIRDVYSNGKKLRYQSPHEWRPNAAFVNCYDGPTESVGYHADELTYLGPHPVIGSLSLGVEREFRVRRVLPDDEDTSESSGTRALKQQAKLKGTSTPMSTIRADAQGQISIHLPHNSLLIMHAEMQEEWKHAISPAQKISPHPIAGNRRINVTYRWYRDTLHPRYIPRCHCGKHAILRCAQRKKETRGRYMWMCYAGYDPGQQGCTFFQWAEFDDDGDPIWGKGQKNCDDAAPVLTNFSTS